MATTTTWLETKDSTRLALVLVFDGADLAYTTTDDTSGIATAWAATDHTNFRPGLHRVGEVGQSIELFEPKINLSTLGFKVDDAIDTSARDDFASNVIYNDGQGNKTYLTAEIGAGSTSNITVKSSSDFASSGDVFIGTECISYTSKPSSTAFGGTITRGKYALHDTNGGTAFGPPVAFDDTLDSEAYALKVTSVPTVWINRRVRLYATHYENGAWATEANSKIVWEGRIKGYDDLGTNTFEIQCMSTVEELFTSIFNRPWSARMEGGTRVIADENDLIYAFFYENGTVANTWLRAYSTAGGGLTAGTRRDYVDILNDINAQLSTWKTGSDTHSSHNWSVGSRNGPDGPRVFFRVEHTGGGSFADTAQFSLGLNPKIMEILGFDVSDYPPKGAIHPDGGIDSKSYDGTAGQWRQVMGLSNVADGVYEAVAKGPPKLLGAVRSNRWNPYSALRVYYSSENETWANQSNFHPAIESGDAEGFVLVDGAVVAVQYNASYLKVEGWLKRSFSDFFTPFSRQVGAGGIPIMRQVWLERGHIGELLLRFMLSTGNASFNHPDYDVLPADVSLGIPASMVDIKSFYEMDTPMEIYMDKPTPFRDLIETALAASNKNIVLKNGKITIVGQGFEVGEAPTVETLSEDDKGNPEDYARIHYSISGLINRVTFKNKALEPFKGEADEKVVTQNLASITQYGQQKAVVIDTVGVVDVGQVIDSVISPALTLFAHPIAILHRTINYNKLHLSPGDVVKVVDDRVIDPHTGSRGLSGLAAWVKAVSFNWTTGVGRIELAFIPDHPVSKYALLGPSAIVDDTATNGGLDAATLTELTLYPRAMSHSTDGKDISHMTVGDKVRLVERSPASSPTSLTWARELASITTSTNKVTFTAAIGSPAWDSTKKYVLIPDDKSTVASSQRTLAFLADDDNTTGDAANDANLWAAPYSSRIITDENWGATSFYENGQELYTKPDSSYYAQGEPVSAFAMWTLIKNIHNINNYKTRQVLANDNFSIVDTTRTHDAATRKLVWGPAKIPLNGVDRDLTASGLDSLKRKLTAYVRIKGGHAAGTATLYLTTSEYPPVGTSTTAVQYTGRSREYSASQLGTSWSWETISDIDPIIEPGSGQTFTWITLELHSDLLTSEFEGFSLMEGVLTAG